VISAYSNPLSFIVNLISLFESVNDGKTIKTEIMENFIEYCKGKLKLA
jgi:hypothetical protein